MSASTPPAAAPMPPPPPQAPPQQLSVRRHSDAAEAAAAAAAVGHFHFLPNTSLQRAGQPAGGKPPTGLLEPDGSSGASTPLVIATAAGGGSRGGDDSVRRGAGAGAGGSAAGISPGRPAATARASGGGGGGGVDGHVARDDVTLSYGCSGDSGPTAAAAPPAAGMQAHATPATAAAAPAPNSPLRSRSATLHATLTITPHAPEPASICGGSTAATATATATAAVQVDAQPGDDTTPATATSTASATVTAALGAAPCSLAAATATAAAAAVVAAATATATSGAAPSSQRHPPPLPPPPSPPPTVSQRLTLTFREWCTAAGSSSSGGSGAAAAASLPQQHHHYHARASSRRGAGGALGRRTLPLFGSPQHRRPNTAYGYSAGWYDGGYSRLLQCAPRSFWLAATAVAAALPLLLVALLLAAGGLPDLHLSGRSGGSTSGAAAEDGGGNSARSVVPQSTPEGTRDVAVRAAQPPPHRPPPPLLLPPPAPAPAPAPPAEPRVPFADFRWPPVSLSSALDLDFWRRLALGMPPPPGPLGPLPRPSPPPPVPLAGEGLLPQPQPQPQPPPAAPELTYGLKAFGEPLVGERLAGSSSSGDGDGDGGGGGEGGVAGPAAPLGRCPRAGRRVRVLVAVISRCCDEESSAKRAAIRESWGAQLQSYLYDCMDLLFVLAQPPPHQARQAAAVLQREMSATATAGGDGPSGSGSRSRSRSGGDIVFVPGVDTYRNLPNKTLRMIQLALSSPLQYTHIVKCDDDVYVRPHRLLYDVVLTPPSEWAREDGSGGGAQRQPGAGSTATASSISGLSEELVSETAETQREAAREGRGRETELEPAASSHAPAAAEALFCGGVSGWFSHADDGFRPIRDSTSKWYLSPSELSDDEAPLGVPYPVGWMYVMSRDTAERALAKAVHYSREPSTAPAWWGRLPWEDVTMGALLWGEVPLRNHPGFKHPFMACGDDTVVGRWVGGSAKHLDNLAPELLRPLHAAEVAGSWGRPGAADCTRREFQADNFTDWRRWRNEQRDVAVTGRI
ncbi:hypothetical protein PLESTF_000826600 [Pleodorina starrii]|nr:hypothetical protein PLESTF_000826600 [Pleodorina starrii]